MRRDGAFRALLVLLVSAVFAAEVPPPENVNVHCNNTKVIVNWDYSKPQPETCFRIFINGTEGRFSKFITTDHSYDLTDFVWKSQEHYLDYFSVQVTALQGNSQSKNVLSNSFSFNSFKTVDTKCSLGFPPVDVDVDVDRRKATLSFNNPIHFYREVEQTVKAGSEPQFKFTVSSLGNKTRNLGDFLAYCSAKDPICKVDVQLSEEVEKPCFNLKASLYDSQDLKSVMFTDIDKICAPDSAESYEVLLAVILTAIVLSLIVMAVIVILKVKAWTWTTPPNLRPLVIEPSDHPPYNRVPRDEYSTMYIVPDDKCLSISSEDSCHSQNDEHQGAGLNVDHSERSFYAERNLSESSNQTDSSSADCSEKTDCVSLESEEEETERESSPYDRPHVPTHDMGDGDMVTCYGGN